MVPTVNCLLLLLCCCLFYQSTVSGNETDEANKERVGLLQKLDVYSSVSTIWYS